MLGQQARQFRRDGPYRHYFVDHASVYNEIRRRLQEEEEAFKHHTRGSHTSSNSSSS